ncbi:unnamed protein product [Schistosoma bovis]|nr:unnamed protein product [Schistosoma bovis]
MPLGSPDKRTWNKLSEVTDEEQVCSASLEPRIRVPDRQQTLMLKLSKDIDNPICCPTCISMWMLKEANLSSIRGFRKSGSAFTVASSIQNSTCQLLKIV